MKTAVEFFNNELDDILQLYPSEWKDIQLIYIEAKKLEKKQLIDAYETAMETDVYNTPLKIGLDYYNETFKNK